MRNLPLYLSVLLAAICCACSQPRQYRIGVSQCSADDWRAKMNDEIQREAVLHDDVYVEIRSADDSSAKQIEDITYFVDNNFDIIIVAPNEAAALTPIINKVYSDGTPVIIFDRNIQDTTYTARIGVDNKQIGQAAATYARHLRPHSPTALEIYGLPGSTPAEDRHTGFADAFESAGGTIVASVPGNWREEIAIGVVDSLLRHHPDVDIIYAHNDRMAIGAADVVQRMGLDSIKIIGIDAAPNIGIQAVADGVIDATFLYPTEGHRLIQTALAILKGEPYDREQIIPASSAVDSSNADILLLQNEALAAESRKMRILKGKIDDYLAHHSAQNILFYAFGIIIVLLFGVIFLVLKAYWLRKRHQEYLVEQNDLLRQERDKQKDLNDRLTEATRSKLMFFTNVSHDLRTPLTLIAEPVSQLAQASNLDDSQRRLMRLADKNVRILYRLINQILDFRKYENNKLEIALTETDLEAAVTDWMEAFTALALRRSIKLGYHVDIAAGHSATLAIDVEKIERVFFNLLSNAFKYTPAGGKIDVRLSADDRAVSLSVTDTGQGISERDLGSIFDRFFQVDRVHPGGSGIGLSVCKAFVEMHGGTITAQSELKRGSTFTITLPLRHVADKAEELQNHIDRNDVEAELDQIDAQAAFDPDKPVLLVVDDNRDIQSLLTELLESHYNVVCASDGAEGIKKAMKIVPDLVICDLMMPGVDGLECCRRLKSEVSTSHIPFLMLTACSMDEQRVQGYDSGADGYLAKPFSNSVLQARVAALIENRKRIADVMGDPIASGTSTTAARPGTDLDKDFYGRFMDIFNAEMGNAEISVDALASRMGLERSQFYRKIKALTGFSPVELMRKLRLEHSRVLLTTTDATISEIAYTTGFSTPAYFTKCFRDAYGQTPSDLRKS